MSVAEYESEVILLHEYVSNGSCHQAAVSVWKLLFAPGTEGAVALAPPESLPENAPSIQCLPPMQSVVKKAACSFDGGSGKSDGVIYPPVSRPRRQCVK